MVHVCCRTPLKAPPPDTAFGTVGPRFSNYSHAPLLLLGSRLDSRLGSRGWLSRSMAMALVLKGGGPFGVRNRSFWMPEWLILVTN